jgi:hypothetical protein
MALKGDIFLGATSGTMQLMTAFGRKFTVADIEQSRTERTASGKLRREIISVKKKFKLAYEMIDGSELEKFVDLYELWDELVLWVQHTDDSISTTEEPETNYDEYTVIMEPIEYTRELLLSDGLFSGVVIELSEV